jgi:O-antigen ligase
MVFGFIAALFIRDLTSFLIFTLFATLSAGLDFHIIYDPILGVQTGAFAEGIGFDLADFILLILAGGLLIKIGIDREAPDLRFESGISIIWLLWLFWLILVAILWAGRPNYALYETLALLKGYIFFLFILNFPLKRKTLKMIVYGLFLGTTFQALFAIFQFLTRSHFTVAGDAPRYLAAEGFRSIGWLGSADGTAILLVTVIPIALAYYFNDKSRPIRLLMIAIILICIAGTLVTKVRIAGLSLMISLFVLFILGLRSGWIKYGGLIKAVALTLIFLILISPYIVHRFERGSWGEARIPLIITASNMIKKNWLTGVGSSNYLFHLEENLPMELRGSWEAIVHNEYLLRLAETGVVGFVLYYLLLLTICARLWRLVKSAKDPWISFVSAGILAVIIGSLAHRMTSIYHLPVIYSQYCAFFGMTGFMTLLEQREESAEAFTLQEQHITADGAGDYSDNGPLVPQRKSLSG